ncbi:ubiquitin carboxyl-terminal hydrolase isozyme L3 [Harpegnathos saltator]|uniref:Ubiquitin carboxyl-terminal hydrolase n=1 Tax=Harpegnathos saltator TaxID=610380 RepID=E2B4G1_HARSA|nr:ubiquitin carboxyl-terminal hydrolase isozyme L3 [Harpegnathos saltator]EFN89422.1 Ubiquitin carboxyl-terminal hydrolase isozyme L3 [Harpegnathos saltator]
MAWVPLESNPEVMTKFLHKLGVPKKWSVIDVYGLDPELLALVPKPVLSVILLYPVAIKNEKTEEEEEVAKDKSDTPDSVYHMKQCISNACGTIALVHSVANNLDVLQLDDGFLKTFLDETKGLSSAERGDRLINAQGIIDIHMESAQEGQTEAPAEDMEVYHHFIAFVHKDGSLYELDGRKPSPINHGSTSPETLLEDAARVCKDYMARDPEEVRFTVVALAANE